LGPFRKNGFDTEKNLMRKAGTQEKAACVKTTFGVIRVARELLLVTLENCRIHLPAWFAEFIRWHEPDGL